MTVESVHAGIDEVGEELSVWNQYQFTLLSFCELVERH